MRTWISSSRFLTLSFSGCWLDPGPWRPVSACGSCRGCVFSSADFISVLTVCGESPSELAAVLVLMHAQGRLQGRALRSATLEHCRLLPSSLVWPPHVLVCKEEHPAIAAVLSSMFCG